MAISLTTLLETFTLENIIEFARNNILLVVIGIISLYRFFSNFQPIREIEGSKVISIKNTDEYNAQLLDAKV